MTPEDMRAGFEAAIKADPYDLASRLAFSDWLEENGFDDEAAVQRKWTPERMRDAERAMEDFAESLASASTWTLGGAEWLSADQLAEAAHAYLDRRERLRTGDWQPEEKDMERFWEAFETWTGRPVAAGRRRDDFTSCCNL